MKGTDIHFFKSIFVFCVAAFGGLPSALAHQVRLSEAPRTLLYQIYVESFQDHDLADGVGDVAGIESRLDYLSQLGVGGIVLMPIFESEDGLGYIAIDYHHIKREYAGIDPSDDSQSARDRRLKQLLSHAHALGISVYLDLPINHVGRSSVWFKNSQNRVPGFEDDLIWTDTPTPGWVIPWLSGSTAQDVFHWDETRHQYYYGLFGPSMADLNYRIPAVQKAILEVMRRYLDLGADGFRVDAASHLVEGVAENSNPVEPDNLALLQQFYSQIRAVYPQASFLLEAWSGNPSEFEPYVPASGDVVYDYAYLQSLRDSVLHDHPWAIRQYLRHLTEVQSQVAPGNRILMPCSHDLPRLRTALGDVQSRSEIAIALGLLLPYPTLLYYGDEIFTSGDYIRSTSGEGINQVSTPMAWNAEHNAGFTDASLDLGQSWNKAFRPDFYIYNVDTEQKDPESLLNRVMALSAARQKLPIANDSRLILEDQDPSDPILKFSVQFADGSCLVAAINFSDTHQSIDFPLGSLNCSTVPSDELIAARAGFNPDGQLDLGERSYWVGYRKP